MIPGDEVLGYVLAQVDTSGTVTLLQSAPRKNAEHLRRQLDGYTGRGDVRLVELRAVELPRHNPRAGAR